MTTRALPSKTRRQLSPITTQDYSRAPKAEAAHTCSSTLACQLGTGFTTKLAVLVLLLRGDNHKCGDNPKIAASPLLWGEECDPPVCLGPAAPLEAVV